MNSPSELTAVGVQTPGKTNEAIGLAGHDRFKGQTTSNSQDCATHGFTDQAFDAMRMRAERCRCSLYGIADGYLLTRQAWGLSKQFPDLRSVARVLRMMEAN